MSRLGTLRHIQQRLTTSSRQLKRYRTVEWSRVERLHFVCKGNVCRSAYACERAKMLGVAAVSSGVHAGSMFGADPNAISVAARRDVLLDQHLTSAFEHALINASDLVVAMEPWQASTVRKRVDDFDAQITLLGLWVLPPQLIVEDPYGNPDDVFDSCFDVIDNGTARLAHLMRYRE